MSVNPYESPPTVVDSEDSRARSQSEFCWCDGHEIVVSSESQLPLECVFCCGTTVRLVNYKFTVNPRLTLDRFLGLVIIAVCVVAGSCLIFLALSNRASSRIAVALVGAVAILVIATWYRQRAANRPRLERAFPVCERHRFQNAFVYVAWGTLLATLALRSFEILPDSAYIEYLIYPVLLLNAFLPKSLTATRYQSGHFWISGCGKRYCDGLPNWGGSRGD